MTLAQIGRKKPATNFVGMILECHERIRSFSALARRLAEAEGAAPAEVKEAAHSIRRYFSEALPLHVQDEEQTLVPRLRGKESALDAALDEMCGEHTAHEPSLSSLLQLCERLENEPGALPAVRQELTQIAEALEREFHAHLDNEERQILPAVTRLLSLEEQALMIDELRARRR
jgi:iron-sulfur cluster repair protein YtfE (RIC family)